MCAPASRAVARAAPVAGGRRERAARARHAAAELAEDSQLVQQAQDRARAARRTHPKVVERGSRLVAFLSSWGNLSVFKPGFFLFTKPPKPPRRQIARVARRWGRAWSCREDTSTRDTSTRSAKREQPSPLTNVLCRGASLRARTRTRRELVLACTRSRKIRTHRNLRDRVVCVSHTTTTRQQRRTPD